MKNFIAVFISLAIFQSALPAQKKHANFKGAQFDSVMIFEFLPSMDGPFPSERNDIVGRPVNRKAGERQAYLTKMESDSLYGFLIDTSSFDCGASICWNPHLGVVFMKDGVAVNYIEVCMDCNKLYSYLRIKNSEPVKMKGANVYLPTGLSGKFRDYINALLTRYHFTHIVKDNPCNK
ncbi:MAG TPA: hypothetical protein VI112_02305 [Bacteroidia bacterium]